METSGTILVSDSYDIAYTKSALCTVSHGWLNVFSNVLVAILQLWIVDVASFIDCPSKGLGGLLCCISNKCIC